MSDQYVAFPTHFYREGTSTPFHEERMEPTLIVNIGDGLLGPDAKRYRVVDRWLSFDHRGYFDLGYHLFLDAVEEDGNDDRLGRAAPSYFSP
jgi:hypothetical protein